MPPKDEEPNVPRWGQYVSFLATQGYDPGQREEAIGEREDSQTNGEIAIRLALWLLEQVAQ